MKMDDFYEKRLRDLEKNITEDQKLLKEYENSLRYEYDPRVIGKYKREIERQRESVTFYQQEFTELKLKLIDNQPTQVQHVESQLQQMDEKINVLLKGQIAIYKNQYQMRQEILERYKASEKAIITSITQQLNETQLVLTENLLQA